MANYKQGLFTPKNPQKYMGDPKNIVYRSGWEKRVMDSLDDNLNVIRWASEEIAIPYVSPIDNRVHRYFVDFYVEAVGRDGGTKVMLLEGKPADQTKQPVKPKRNTKRFITEMMTYGVNQAKWEAAKAFCDKKGWEFKIITEQELFKKKSK